MPLLPRATRARRKTSDSYEFTSFWADAKNRNILDLKPDETAAFVKSAFVEGGIPETGTAVNEIMKPMSRFARRRGGGRAAAKARVVERMKAYYERFADIAPHDVNPVSDE